MTTRTVNTLVDDIYKKLSALGEGKSLDLSEEVIEQFGESMKDVLRHWSTPLPRSEASLRMSNTLLIAIFLLALEAIAT